jgi:hypothetical protein
MANDLSTVDLKINEIIDILMLHPEAEAPPENYRELGEHLARFKLQNSRDSLEDIFSMVSTFEVNRDEDRNFHEIEDKVEELICRVKGLHEDRRYKCLCIALIFHQNDLLQSQMPEWESLSESDEFYEEGDIDESGGEPDNGEPEETGGSYSDDESFFNEFGDKPLDDEAECLSAHYNQKYYKERENSFSCSHSTLTAVENNVVLGLIIQIKKDTGGYGEAFLTTMQDTLQLVGFSTPQIWEIMTQHLNPESQRFNSADVQSVLQQDFDTHEYN